MPVVHLRDAKPVDVPQIEALVGLAYSVYLEKMGGRPPAPLLSDYEALVASGVVRVGVHDDRVVAVLVMWPEEDHLFIENVAVDPDHQGKGLGAALLADAEEAAKTHGLSELRLYTNDVMTENLTFYPSQGFEETHRSVEGGYARVYYRRPVTVPASAVTELADFRRQVSDLYHEVRVSGASAASWAAWRAERDELFRTHRYSPLAGVEGLDAAPFWPYDPSWRLTGTVVASAGAGVSVEPEPGVVERFDRIGLVHFSRRDVDHQLPIYWSASYSGGLFLPFRDKTSGTETFGSGRYLLDGAKSADLGQRGADLVLDFNFAYHPSCVWGDWVCPLPSADAMLDVEVRAGEQRPPTT